MEKSKKLLAIAAMQSISALRAGYSLADVKEWESIPVIDKMYTKLWEDIEAKRRKHNQSEWGPECDPKENLCGTQMLLQQ